MEPTQRFEENTEKMISERKEMQRYYRGMTHFQSLIEPGIERLLEVNQYMQYDNRQMEDVIEK